MLDAEMKSQLGSYLERLVTPVQITAMVDESKESRDMLSLLADIAALSPKVSVTESRDGGGRVPAFSLARPGEPARVTFAGLPMVHEFTSVVLAVLHVCGYAQKLEQAVIDESKGLEGGFECVTYTSMSCQNCSDVVQALNLMAVLNPRIRHTMVDGALYEQEVAAQNIRSVPTVKLNGETFGQGRMEVEEILAKLDTGVEKRIAAQMNAEKPYDVL